MKTIELVCGDWEAQIAPEYAMNVIRLRRGGTDILRFPGSESELEENPFVYGTPLLFPPNRTAGGTFSIDDVWYSLPITELSSGCNLHGSMYNAPFSVTSSSRSGVEGEYVNVGERFPFPFKVEISCMLSHQGLRQIFKFTNTGMRRMPLLFGLHTTFRALGEVRAPISCEYERDARSLPTGALLPLDKVGEGVRNGLATDSCRISGYYKASGRCAEIGDYRYEVSEGFTHWTLWNGGANSGLIAIEPQTGPVNGLNMHSSLRMLESGKTDVFTAFIGSRFED